MLYSRAGRLDTRIAVPRKLFVVALPVEGTQSPRRRSLGLGRLLINLMCACNLCLNVNWAKTWAKTNVKGTRWVMRVATSTTSESQTQVSSAIHAYHINRRPSATTTASALPTRSTCANERRKKTRMRTAMICSRSTTTSQTEHAYPSYSSKCGYTMLATSRL